MASILVRGAPCRGVIPSQHTKSGVEVFELTTEVSLHGWYSYNRAFSNVQD